MRRKNDPQSIQFHKFLTYSITSYQIENVTYQSNLSEKSPKSLRCNLILSQLNFLTLKGKKVVKNVILKSTCPTIF